MSIVNCACCSKAINLDVEDGTFDNDNNCLCSKCSIKEKIDLSKLKASRADINNHHLDEFKAGVL